MKMMGGRQHAGGSTMTMNGLSNLSIHVRIIRGRAFLRHPNIIEVICHKVERIEEEAFDSCPRLKRVIMRGASKLLSGGHLLIVKPLRMLNAASWK